MTWMMKHCEGSVSPVFPEFAKKSEAYFTVSGVVWILDAVRLDIFLR